MAAAFGASVTLCHVSEATSLSAVNPLDWHLRKAEAEAYLREQADSLRKVGLPVDSALLEGPVAERIVEYADRQQVDLIILNSHGQGGLSEWSVSHIAQKILQRGVTSILLVRADQARHNFEDQIRPCRILVPLDGSRRAECVLPIASTLAEQEQAELLLAHVTARPVIFNRLPATAAENTAMEWLIDHNRAGANRYLQDLADRIRSVVGTALLVSDNIALTLHQLVTDEAVDLVLLSAHGGTAQSQWSYGSLVSNFITNGLVPLFIVQDLPQALNQQSPVQHPQRQALHGSSQSAFTFGR